MQLHEQYRPRSLDEIAGQTKAVSTLRRLIGAGIGGDAFWLSGPTGTGKTTLAKIIAAEIADDFFVAEYIGRKMTLSLLDQIKQDSRLSAWGKGGRAVIVNEAHGLGAPAIEELLDLLEDIPKRFVWLFTTTKAGEERLFEHQIDAHPLLSRCIPIPLTSQGLAKPGAAYVKRVAEAAGLDGQPIERYVRLVGDCRGNLRQALQQVRAGAMMEKTQ